MRNKLLELVLQNVFKEDTQTNSSQLACYGVDRVGIPTMVHDLRSAACKTACSIVA